jgi:hypothetical protein
MDQPIACTLSSDDYRTRVADLAALADRALRAREPTLGGARLTFAGDERTEHELRAAIAAEATCCAFLRFGLERRGDVLVLDVSGPPEARPVIAALFE